MKALNYLTDRLYIVQSKTHKISKEFITNCKNGLYIKPRTNEEEQGN